MLPQRRVRLTKEGRRVLRESADVIETAVFDDGAPVSDLDRINYLVEYLRYLAGKEPPK